MRFLGICLGLLLPILAQASSARAAGDFGGRFQHRVDDAVGAERARSGGSYAVAVISRDTAELTRLEAVAPDNLVYPASSIKTLVALAVFRLVDRHALALGEVVAIDQPNAAQECPEWDCRKYGPGARASIRQLLWDMITVSNNIATNQLIDIAGKDLINQTAGLVEAPSLRLFHKVYSSVNPEPGIERRNTASAAGMVQLYREIATGRLRVLSEESRAALIDILGHQRINDRLNARFPRDVRFYHKTGSTSFSSSDAGFYYLPDGDIVILAALQSFRAFAPLQKLGRETFELVSEASKGLVPAL